MNRSILVGVLLVFAIGSRAWSASTTVYVYEDVAVTGGIRSTDVTRTYTYDTDEGQPLKDTQTLYDDVGRQSQVTQVAGDASIVTTYVYDASGVVVTKLVGSLKTVYAYDLRGRQVTVKGPSSALDGNTDARVIYDYDVNSNVTKQRTRIGPGNIFNKTITDYDALNRPTKTYSPVAESATPTDYRQVYYDSQNRVFCEYAVSGSTVLQQSRTAYDGAGRVAMRARMLDPTSTDPVDERHDEVSRYAYDRDGRVVREIKYDLGNLARPLTTVSAYDGFGRLTKRTDPQGFTDEVVYDTSGFARTRIRNDGTPHYTFLDYDNRGRVTQSTVESDLVTAYAYDGAGRRTLATDPNGHQTSYNYDMLGRQTLVTEDVGGLNRQTQYVYSSQGMMVTQVAVVDGSSKDQPTIYDYSPEGIVSKITYPDGGIIHFDYYPNGAVRRKIDQSGATLAYYYDERGLMLTKANSTSPDSYWLTYIYDGLGRISSARRGTPSNPTSLSEIVYQYDGLSRQISESQSLGGSAARVVGAGFDQLGKRVSLGYPTTNPQ